MLETSALGGWLGLGGSEEKLHGGGIRSAMGSEGMDVDRGRNEQEKTTQAGQGGEAVASAPCLVRASASCVRGNVLRGRAGACGGTPTREQLLRTQRPIQLPEHLDCNNRIPPQFEPVRKGPQRSRSLAFVSARPRRFYSTSTSLYTPRPGPARVETQGTSPDPEARSSAGSAHFGRGSFSERA